MNSSRAFFSEVKYCCAEPPSHHSIASFSSSPDTRVPFIRNNLQYPGRRKHLSASDTTRTSPHLPPSRPSAPATTRHSRRSAPPRLRSARGCPSLSLEATRQPPLVMPPVGRGLRGRDRVVQKSCPVIRTQPAFRLSTKSSKVYGPPSAPVAANFSREKRAQKS